MAKPVTFLVSVASALIMSSPTYLDMAASLILLDPAAKIKIGCCESLVVKISDLTICDSSQPILSAASWAVLALLGSSIIEHARPWLFKAF